MKNRTWLRGMMGIVLMAAISNSSIAQTSAPADSQTSKGQVRTDIVFPPTTRVALVIPPPLMSDDIIEAARLMNMSEEQRLFALRSFDSYCLAYVRMSEPEFPRLVGLSEIIATSPKPHDWNYVAIMTEFMEKQRHLFRLTVALDEELLAKVKTILSEDQVEGLDRFRRLRERGRCGWVDRNVFAARIDLAALMRETASSVVGQPNVDRVLDEYERLVTPLMIALNTAVLQQQDKLTQIVVARRMSVDGVVYVPGTPESLEHDRAGRTKMESLLGESAELQNEIANLNQAYVDRLVTTMDDPEVAKPFVAEYQRRAFPRLYPDHNDTSTFLAKISTDARLPKDVQLALMELIGTVDAKRRLINSGLESESLRWM